MVLETGTLKAAGEVRSTYRFVIPEYQRGYAWTRNQWVALWEDLLSTDARRGSEHFAGSLMLQVKGDGQRIEVVDGQQRLTSMSLLLHALGHKGFDLAFQNNEALQTYFDYYAKGSEAAHPRLGQFRSYYARNVQEAAQYFEGVAGGVSEKDRKRLVQVLLERFKLVVLMLAPEFDVHVAFETINNRGKPLSLLERLKNRLIYLCAMAADKDAGREAADCVHRSWVGIYDWLGRGGVLLSDDEFLRAHAVGWFRKEHRAEWLTTQLFEEEFSSKSTDVSPAKVEQYAMSLERLARWWFHLHNRGELPQGVQKALQALERTQSASAKPVLLWAMERCSRETPALTGDARAGHDWSGFVELVREAERFAVLVVYANDRLSHTGQNDFNRSAFALAHPGEAIGVSAQKPPRGDKQAVTFAAAHMRSLVANWDMKDFDNEDAELADRRFDWVGYFEPQTMVDVIAGRVRQGRGFYDWQLGKLILYEWEGMLRGEKGLPEKTSWQGFSWDESIEHIYPQTPVAGWSEHIALAGKSSDGLRRAVVNSLGNLLLLSGSRNASVSNNMYTGSADRMKDKRSRYLSGSYSEWQVAACAERWTVAAIAARGIAMMEFAQRRWGFKVVGEEAAVTEWLPVLFGDKAEEIRQGKASDGVPVDGRSIRPMLERFRATMPG